MERDVVCPECGGELEIDSACKIEETYVPRYIVRDRELPRRTRTAPAALCTSCDFCIEITV